jgi:DNA-binding response OmpR family regulator
VDTHVAELRRKLEEDPQNPAHLLTVRKAGYRLCWDG